MYIKRAAQIARLELQKCPLKMLTTTLYKGHQSTYTLAYRAMCTEYTSIVATVQICKLANTHYNMIAHI